MSKLRFAQAGVSLMHAAMYRDTLMLLSDEIELVGFYDPDPDAVRERVKPDAAHVPFYPDLGSLLAAARPDAVMVFVRAPSLEETRRRLSGRRVPSSRL